MHKRCIQLRHQLQCGVFNNAKTDYLRTDAGGHLDLIDALKYLCLAVNWNEIIHVDATQELQQGQIIVGANPFASAGTFGGGIVNRPVR